MEERKTKSVFEKVEKEILKPILTSVIAILASLMMNVATLTNLKTRKPLVIGIFAGFVVIVIVAQMTTSYLHRGPSRVAVLKSTLRDAYLGSLDASGLNPTRTGGE